MWPKKVRPRPTNVWSTSSYKNRKVPQVFRFEQEFIFTYKSRKFMDDRITGLCTVTCTEHVVRVCVVLNFAAYYDFELSDYLISLISLAGSEWLWKNRQALSRMFVSYWSSRMLLNQLYLHRALLFGTNFRPERLPITRAGAWRHERRLSLPMEAS